MQQTVFAMLTDEQARTSEAIEANLRQELVVGAPWFFTVLAEPLATQTTANNT